MNKIPLADVSKAAIEFPLKGMLASKPAPAPAPTPVAWHASFDAALEASRDSGKPVMLFLMLGRMDEEHC